jgi:hypothetical protein
VAVVAVAALLVAVAVVVATDAGRESALIAY